jgi:hypothetical protein
MNSRRTILSFAGVAAVVFMCDPMFVFAVVFAPVGAVTVGLLFGEPIGATVVPVAWLRVPICAPGFIPGFAPILGTFGAVVPVRGITVELPLEPVCPATMPAGVAVLLLTLVPLRGVCARLNDIVATHIIITASLIDVIRFIWFSLRPSRPLFRLVFNS